MISDVPSAATMRLASGKRTIVAALEAALDVARSAKMVSVLHAGPERYAMGDGCGCPTGQQTSQQFAAIEEDLKN